MIRQTMKRQSCTLGLVMLLAVGTRAPIQAALPSSLVNGDFESGTDGVYSNLAAGFVSSATNPGWNGFGNYGNGAGVWFDSTGAVLHTPAIVFPAWTGLRAGSLIGTQANHESIMYQLLGTVDASDLGKTFSVTADLGARGFANRSYDGTMTIGFASSATVANDGDPDAPALGTPGVLDVDTNPSSLPVPQPFGMFSVTGSFTPAAADIGTEVFAAIHLVNLTTIENDENQYIVDNVNFSVVPEPSMFFLAFVACCGAPCLVRRSR